MNTPCFDKGLARCVCGTNPEKAWEMPNWCGRQLMSKPKPITEKELILMDYRERLVRKVRYYCANAAGLEHDLIDIIYRA